MTGSGSHRIALMVASLVSGPVYIAAYAAGSVIDSLPQPIVIDSPDVVRFAISLITGLIGGFFISVVPLGFIILMLSLFASIYRFARGPIVWTLTGGAAAGLIAWGEDADEFGYVFALIAAGMASLRIAHMYLDWPSEPQPLLVRSAGNSQAALQAPQEGAHCAVAVRC